MSERVESGRAVTREVVSGFFCVPISTFLPGSTLPFRIFTFIGTNPIIFRDAGRAFEPEHRVALAEQGNHQIAIAEEERELYHSYLQSNVSALLAVDDHDTNDALHFREQSRAILQSVYQDPSTPEAAKNAQAVVAGGLSRLERTDCVLSYLNQMLEASPDLYAHSLQVTLYGLALANSLGVDENQVRELGVGLLLHDVGKIALPMEPYSRETPLNDAEWEMMKKHPQFGLDAVGENPEIGTAVREVILDHHETLDGAGYPGGKMGSDLGIAARIAAIVNTFDRRTTARSYREARSAVDVLRDMIQTESSRYDPQILASFVRLLAN